MIKTIINILVAALLAFAQLSYATKYTVCGKFSSLLASSSNVKHELLTMNFKKPMMNLHKRFQ